jgi:gliding motility-associated-like protein
MMKRLALIAFYCLAGLSVLQAQTTKGTDFWLVYMENISLIFNGDPEFTIYIDADVATTGTISAPATGLSIDFTAPAGSHTPVTLPAAIWYTEGSEVIETKGLRIQTDQPVSVHAFHYRIYFSESSLLLPAEELGTEYYTSSYPDEGGASTSPTSFVITSTEDDNEIEIIPTALTLGLKPAGVPFTITLDQGENYQVQSLGDLTGSRIRSLSDKKIAVFTGSKRSFIELCSSGADNHLWDQMPPADQWGTSYYFVPFKDQGGDLVRIVASEDNTEIFADCDLLATLDAGEFFETKLVEAVILNSAQPFAVSQFNSSQGCNPSGIGDPSMLQLFPTERQLLKARFSALNTGQVLSGPIGQLFEDHYINIVVRSGDEGNITLDGNPISAAFQPFDANPEVLYAQVEVSTGVHLIESSTFFHAYSYGFGDFDAYTNNLGYEGVTDVTFSCLEIVPEGLYCVDSAIVFTAFTNLDIQSWDWDLGDGTFSSDSMPEHVYDAPGTYTITVAVETGSGLLTDELTIEIFDCPEDPCINPVEVELTSSGNPCDGLLLTYISDSVFVSVQWDFGNGEQSTEQMPEVLYSEEGVYTIQFTGFDAYNCVYTADLTVDVPNCSDPCFIPGGLQITPVGALCVDSLITFTINYVPPVFPPPSIEWIFSDGTVIFGQTEPTLSFSEGGTLSVELIIFDSQGCNYAVGLDLFIDDDCEAGPCDDLPPVNFGVEGAFCVDSLLVFSAVSDAQLASFLWDMGNGNTFTSATAPGVYDSPGVYTVSLEAKDVNGCDYELEISFDIEDCDDPCSDNVPLIIQPNGVFCVDSLVSFGPITIVELAFFNWDLGNGLISFDTIPATSYDAAGPYTISLFATDVIGCEYEAELTIDIEECEEDPCLEFPELEIVSSGAFCIDSLIVFEVDADVNLTFWEWSFENGTTSFDEMPVTSFAEAGTYSIKVSVTDENGCDWEADLLIDVEPCCNPDPFLVIDTIGTPCIDSLLIFTFQTDLLVDSWSWLLPDGEVVVDANAVYFPSEEGLQTIELSVTDQEGCEYVELQEIEVDLCLKDCTVAFPNAFSPNNDGTNDGFGVISECRFDQYSLKIFNRWGALVFETSDPQEEWNGLMNGSLLTSDVYVFLAEYQKAGEGETLQLEYGDVTLIR